MKALKSVLLAAVWLLSLGCKGQSASEVSGDVVAPVVSALKSNVLYVGFENPLAIAVPGIPCSSLKVLSDNGEVAGANCQYSIRPKNVGIATITINGTTPSGLPIQGTSYFRVCDVPSPVPVLAGRTRQDHTVQREALEKSSGLILKLADFNFDVLFSVSHFEVCIISSTRGAVRYPAQSWKFTNEMRDAFQSLKPGEDILIHDIRALGPSSEVLIEDLYLVVE